MPWSAWLGIPGNISMDAGYGYIIQRTGILVCAFLWFLFAIVPLKDDQARCFHFNAAIYAALNLCISGSSLFSLKTTAVLWLLLGTVIAHRSIADPAAHSSTDSQRPRAGAMTTTPSTRAIGGFRVLATTTDDLIALLSRRRAERRPTELLFANTNFVVTCGPLADAVTGPETLIVNDGIGLDLASWLFHSRFFPENLNGTDFTPRLIASLDRPTRVFLLGAQPAVVRDVAQRWSRLPNVDVVGAVDGFDGMADDAALLDGIRAATPDILFSRSAIRCRRAGSSRIAAATAYRSSSAWAPSSTSCRAASPARHRGSVGCASNGCIASRPNRDAC